MPLPLAMLVLAPPQPAVVFDQAIAAFRARKAFSVSIAMDTMMDKSMTSERFSLQFSPPFKVLLTRIVGGKTYAVFWLNGPTFTAYDPGAGEMVSRPAPTKGPVVNRLANLLGGLADPVSAQLSPDTMEAFLSPFRMVKGWSVSSSAGTIVLSRGASFKNGKSLTRLEFSTRSHLLTKAILKGPTSKLQWVFNYGPNPRTVAFHPSRGTRSVRAFSGLSLTAPSEPRAKAMVDASVKGYSNLKSAVFSVSGSKGQSMIWISGNSFRERQQVWDWSYAKGALSIRNLKTGQAYRGKCRPGAISTYLLKIRSPMEPILQALVRRKNPLREWISPIMFVESRGTVEVGSITADAVELRTRFLEISLLIRRDSRLLSSVASRTYDENNRVISSARRDFTYTSVNQPVGADAFAISGTKTLPLTKLGK